MFTNPIFLTFVMTVAIGTTAGFLGTLMLGKRMSLVGGPLGHLTLPGITLALLYGFDVSLGAFGVLILAILIIWFFEKRTRLPLDTLTAIVFSTSVAFAFLFLPHDEIEIALIGDISLLTPIIAFASVALSALVFIIIELIYRQIVLTAISEDIARSEGINVDHYNLLYLLCVALTIGLGIRLVGSLLTAAIVAIPAATARNLSRNLKQYLYGGAFMGGLAAALGLGIHFVFALPAGPAVILTSGVLFLISTLFTHI
jgi:ABC-type Mn2+/Zn2+ transport system permease subunit